MTTPRDLEPGNTVRLVGTQTLHHFDNATGQLLTYEPGSELRVVSVGDDDDEPGACLIVFAADGHEVSLVCGWDTDFMLA